MALRTAKDSNQQSRKGTDETKPGRTEKVSQIERVGGKSAGSHSFPIVNHPEVCDVSHGPRGKMDR